MPNIIPSATPDDTNPNALAPEHARRQKSLLAAHSVALYIQQVAPVPPTTISVTCRAFAPDAPSLDVAFYCDPEGVKGLAAALGAEVTERPHTATNPALYTSARAEVCGISVKIWTLGDAPETGGAS